MRTIIAALALALAACTQANDDVDPGDCRPVIPECDGECTIVIGHDREGHLIEHVWTEPGGVQTHALYYDDGVVLMTRRHTPDGESVVESWCWPSGAAAYVYEYGEPATCFTKSGAAYPCEHPPREVSDLYWAGWSYTTEGGPF